MNPYDRSRSPGLAPFVALALSFAGALVSPAQTTPSANAGLWMGEVTLRAVTNVVNATLEPTASQPRLRLLLHVDASDKVRLLKEVIVARAGGSDAVLLFSDPARIGFSQVARDVRAAAQAQRFASVAFDFEDTDGTADHALELAGSLAAPGTVTGTLVLGAAHPTNPFRHKYHPDHANEGARAFVITRDIRLTIVLQRLNGNGTLLLEGTYEETIRGLRSQPLVTQGTFSLSRASTTDTLNP